MNYLSKRVVTVRIAVKSFDVIAMKWLYQKPEIVGNELDDLPVYNAFDFKRLESIHLRIYVYRWLDGQILPNFELGRKAISKCLDRIYIHCDNFGYSD